MERQWYALLWAYAMSGTEIAYAAISLRDVRSSPLGRTASGDSTRYLAWPLLLNHSRPFTTFT
eukprot:2559981-Rhodomonas_salina.2